MQGGTHPEHGEIVVPLLHRIIDRVDKARVVFSALCDIICASTGRRRHVVAHNLRDKLRGLLSIILERLVRIRVSLHNQVDVSL